ncbi:MAG: metallophosphoesterase family protein [Acidocella sp.]|nr:metallophosphoesterase family protein [Acidocella sp.]
MRILSFSDIHDDVEAVRRLRFLESNRFDAIIIAGDMGQNNAAEILRISLTFECPVLYVVGNHDTMSGYDGSIRAPAIHIHNGPTVIDKRCVVGYSGVDIDWGCNQIANQVWDEFGPLIAKYKDLEAKDTELAIAAAEFSIKYGFNVSRPSQQRERLHRTRPWIKYQDLITARRRTVFDRNIVRVSDLLKETGMAEKNAIFVSHARTFKIQKIMPSLGMHLFGHAHGFKDTKTGETRFVNVSALDLARSIIRKKISEFKVEVPGLPTFNFGTYTVIEISKDDQIITQSIRLWSGGEEYETIRGKIEGNPSVHSESELWTG